MQVIIWVIIKKKIFFFSLQSQIFQLQELLRNTQCQCCVNSSYKSFSSTSDNDDKDASDKEQKYCETIADRNMSKVMSY